MQAIMYTAVIQAILQTLFTSDFDGVDKLSLPRGLLPVAMTLVIIETFLPISLTSQNNSRNAMK